MTLVRKLIIIFLFSINAIGEISQKRDTSFLLKKTFVHKSYQKVFIDYNRNSEFVQQLKRNTKIDVHQFDQTFGSTVAAILKSNQQFSIERLATNWYPLYLYKGKYYLYSASDPGTSTWIGIKQHAVYQLYFDPGIVPAVIEHVSQVNDRLIQLKLFNEPEGHYSLNIHLVNENKGLAVFEKINKLNEKTYWFMVREANMKDYPIVVNDCKEQRTDEFKFDKIDYSKLLSLSQDKEQLSVGGRIYHSKDKQIFLKDDSLNSVWRTFYTSDQRHAFSYEILATKNEHVYRKGFIEVDRQQNIIKNRELFYYDQLYAVDSVHRYLKLRKNGLFELFEQVEFKAGKPQIIFPIKKD
ncbi:MAG: hypothetical protein PHD73_12370 [Sediminibacterium sp.]|nr:hypothetical protein [Sediminibacterium sp.]